MTLFVAKPPTVDAVKWDGTLEGFELIRALLRRSGQTHIGFSFRTNGSLEDGFTGGWVDIEARFVGGRDAQTRIYEDCWLIYHQMSNLFEILGDERFKQLYTEYEETE